MPRPAPTLARLADTLRSAARTADAALPRFPATTEQVVVAASLFWVLSANGRLLAQTLRLAPTGLAAGATLAVAIVLILWAVHALLLLPVATRLTVRPAVTLLTLAAAAGSYFMSAYGVVLDPSMLRNVLRTNPAEAGELLTASFAVHMLLYGLLPCALLWRARISPRPWRRALIAKSVLAAIALAVLGTGLWLNFQTLSSWMRNQKDARYRVTPANIVWSTSRVLAADARTAAAPRRPIGQDAAPGASWAQRSRPLVVVLVVGETARAANWGLSGYSRQTTPQLARLEVVDLPRVQACGTNTEVSLPCMFAPVGRRDHDEDRISSEESLLHVLARAGVGVHWRDNQSGCKGVCDGLPSGTASPRIAPGLCNGERCLDEALVVDLPARLRAAQGTQLWALHMIGNHGPGYWRRYPPTFARFQPECRQDDLRTCTIEQIVNSYDNALLYTDHVLARAIAALQAASDRVDSALVYVSDHGESLGERGLFLHGMPYRIAPREQLEVPMVWWASAGLERAVGFEPGCLAQALRRPAPASVSHDHLFHSMLGLLDVDTALKARSLDLVGACRRGQ